MKKISLLSLIVPAYRQQRIITKNIKSLRRSLEDLDIPFEIIVVVDGKTDLTYQRASKLRSKKVRILGYKENKGKGFAIKYGVEKARGDIIGFIDSGMDIDPMGVSMLLNHMIWYDADIIVGSKLHPVSQVKYPLWRKILSWGYRTGTRILFGFTVRDTQVGIKFFKENVAKTVFPLLLVKRFAFDVEILAAAYSVGYKKIYEAPVKLIFKPNNSSIKNLHLWKTIFLMLLDTLAIFYRVHFKRYYKRMNKKSKRK
jgi:glycosyltransferase involved in cell wall biosynthesis